MWSDTELAQVGGSDGTRSRRDTGQDDQKGGGLNGAYQNHERDPPVPTVSKLISHVRPITKVRKFQ